MILINPITNAKYKPNVMLNSFQHRISERPCDHETSSGRRNTLQAVQVKNDFLEREIISFKSRPTLRFTAKKLEKIFDRVYKEIQKTQKISKKAKLIEDCVEPAKKVIYGKVSKMYKDTDANKDFLDDITHEVAVNHLAELRWFASSLGRPVQERHEVFRDCDIGETFKAITTRVINSTKNITCF